MCYVLVVRSLTFLTAPPENFLEWILNTNSWRWSLTLGVNSFEFVLVRLASCQHIESFRCQIEGCAFSFLRSVLEASLQLGVWTFWWEGSVGVFGLAVVLCNSQTPASFWVESVPLSAAFPERRRQAKITIHLVGIVMMLRAVASLWNCRRH